VANLEIKVDGEETIVKEEEKEKVVMMKNIIKSPDDLKKIVN
jgi:hypothetical protein